MAKTKNPRRMAVVVAAVVAIVSIFVWVRSAKSGASTTSRELGVPAVVAREGARPRLYRWDVAPRPGLTPAVVLLHAEGGPRLFLGKGELAPYANALAQAGFLVVMPERDVTAGKSKARLEQVRATIDWVAQQPEVDAKRIAVFGFASGAFDALCEAGDDPRVKAIVSLTGGVPLECKLNKSLPPTLVIHGEKDLKYGPEHTTDLFRLIEHRSHGSEIAIYKDAPHFLIGESLDDATARTVSFIERHMR